jgi:putative ABC transport system permease protein
MALGRIAYVLATSLRGLVRRAGSAVIIFGVAIVAAGAGAAGPVYDLAAQKSILSDSLPPTSGSFLDRGFEVSATGAVGKVLPALKSDLAAELDNDVGSALSARVFTPPIDSIEATGSERALNETFPLIWRTDFCAHLVITGSCPVRADEVVVSDANTAVTGWHVGSQIRESGWPRLLVTGVYKPPDADLDYWALHSQTYFSSNASFASLDAVFTSQATLRDAGYAEQGSAYIDVGLAVRRLRLSDVGILQQGMTSLATSQDLLADAVTVQSSIPDSLQSAQANWKAVADPVTLTTLTVLLLSWLLLFLIVTDSVEARGSEIALAKLRGHGWGSILVVGLAEPAVMLLAALPFGVLAGWAAAAELAKTLVSPGTPVDLPWTAWIAAVAAIAGGLVAVVVTAQRALRRGVVEQFRRPALITAGRGWVIDSILITACVSGLIEVLALHGTGAARSSTLILLVPGLLGLAVAVAASRLLPLGCRAFYGTASRYKLLAAYLALRHIARRAGGVRTTTVLATAFALVTFAFVAWSVGQRNYQLVAKAETGAPEVLTVRLPAGQNLDAIVQRIDPSGRLATAVDTYEGTIAIDPGRFARIAYWPARPSPSRLTAMLRPPEAPPIVLSGPAFRVTVDVSSISIPDVHLYVNMTTGASPVLLGTLPPHGLTTFTGPLTSCPCVLQSLSLAAAGQVGSIDTAASQLNGKLTFVAVDIMSHGRWVPAESSRRLGSAHLWADRTIDAGRPAVITASSRGLTWTIRNDPDNTSPVLASLNVPDPLPAMVAPAAGPRPPKVFDGNGLDGSNLPLRAAAALPWVPGAPAFGVIIDRPYAELAAGYNLTIANQQVWLAAGALPIIRPKLMAAHVQIVSSISADSAAAVLERQGPALASVLFLADAGAAALLAAGAAILGLHTSARRRRYEYAALQAAGVRRRTLRAAVLTEQAVVLGFGTLVGAVTGLIAARFVLSSVPEFTSAPAEPTLSFVPGVGPIAALLAGTVGVLVFAATLSSMTLFNGISADLLRETAE